MGVFEFIICLVGILACAKLAKYKLESRARLYGLAAERNSELLARIDKIEQRLANLETLVIDEAKKKEYERL